MATDGSDGKLLKGLSNTIKDLVAPDPPPNQPVTHCFVMKTGSTINPDDYDPAFKPSGSLISPAGEKLAALFDDIPSVSPAWATSGKHISNLWEILMRTGKAPSKPPPSEEMKKQYHDAKVKLYGSEEGFNNFEKSPFYNSLDKAVKHVTTKQFDLFNLKREIQKVLGPNASQAVYDSTFQRMSPPYIDAVKGAQEELMLRQRAIDQYTTILFAYNTGSLENVLKAFKNKMDTYKRGTDAEVYYEVSASPSDWWKYFKTDYTPGGDGWTEVTINQEYSTTTSHDTYSQMGGGVRFLFFSFGGKKGETVKTTSEDTKGLSISFKVKTVDIRRPWMDTALLDYTCLTLADASAGQWSDGKMQASTSQSFPLLPTAMVLATDIQVTATQFSSHTKDVFEEFSAGGRGRWNLFCFGGDNSDDSHSSTAVWNKDTQTMTIKGTQIIGYSCALIPFFPASDDIDSV